ncbi:MAG TPA: ABC transporter substrate-binding protein [Longimicrobium sp.]|nr:ABC transporter substrate-binding protein [Longimicrobium sp.]
MPNASGGPPSALRILSALLLPLLAACAGDRGGDAKEGPAKSAEETPERGGTAVTAEVGDMVRPLSMIYQSEIDGDLIDVMYMGLTRPVWRDGRLTFLTSNDSPMALAWHWEYASADSSALRFRMKSGLRWSDGRPITAHDVAWTFRTIKDPRTASPRGQDLAQLDSVVAENDSVVLFHFQRRNPEMLFTTSIPVAPRHPYEGTAPDQLGTHPAFNRPESLVVSGPFKIGERRPGERIVLVRNPTFSVPALLDRLVIRVIPEPATRLVELRTGNVDMVKAITFDQVPELRQRAPNLRFASIEKRYWEYVAYNPRPGSAFADPRVRRALGQALDVDGMITALRMEPFTARAAGPYAPIFRDLYDPQRMRPLPFDPEGARRMLEASGWRDADGDGVREKDGTPLRFTLVTNTGNQRRADVAQVMQQQWKAVGADMRFQQLEFNTFQQRQMAKEFDALLGSWAVNLSPDISPLFTPGSPFNIVSFADTAAVRLMQEAQAQETAEAANPLWRAAAERIVREQPYTWLYYYDIVVGLGERLKGVRVDTFGAYQNTWEWWIPASRRREGEAAGADTAPDTLKEGR